MTTILRLARPDDAAAIRAIYAPHVSDGSTSFELEVPDVPTMQGRVAKVQQAGLPWLVAEEDAVVGYAYASLHRERAAYRWSIETSVYLAPGARGRKLGSRLMRAVLAIVELQGYRSALAGLTLPNPASLALHQRLGFEEVGGYRDVGFKNGAWADVWWGQRILGSPSAPAPPRPLEELDPSRVQGILALSEPNAE